MIETLSVRDLAVVEKADISFHSALNTITGETGAGKSVLIGAIGLLTGAKADRSQVRAGAAGAQVRATVQLTPETLSLVAPLLEEADIDPCEEGMLLLSRSVQASGAAGRCSVNHCPASVQFLKKLGALLVDFHGPHDNQSLLDPAFQLRALDAFGESAEALAHYRGWWQKIRELEKRKEALSGDSENFARELDLLRYQVAEIERAKPDPEADGDALTKEYRAATNAARIMELGGAVTSALSEGECAATEVLACAVRALEEMRALAQGDAEEWLSELRGCVITLSELSNSIASSISEMDASPEHLEMLEQRISLIENLRHKYGRTIPEVLAFLEKSRERLALLEGREETLAGIEKELEKTHAKAREAAEKLTHCRKKAAGILAGAVQKELRDLGLARADFSVRVAPLPAPAATGNDFVSFDFAPNPGEPMRELRQIASSGEISRVMLALKTVLAAHDLIPILIFDEIDANVGGEIAHIVGRKLAALGARHQVLCITHLPQVAACGEKHFAVRKEIADNRTFTSILALEEDARIEEISRMLGGASLTSVTREHARELLENSKS